MLEIYNLKDSTHVVCMGPHGEPEFQVSGGYGIPTGIMGFSDVQVTDRAIYAVFHGRSFNARHGISQDAAPYQLSVDACPDRQELLVLGTPHAFRISISHCATTGAFA